MNDVVSLLDRRPDPNLRSGLWNRRQDLDNFAGLYGDAIGVYGNAEDLAGPVTRLSGILSGLKGTISPRLVGDVSRLSGNLSEIWGAIPPGISGDVSGLSGPINRLVRGNVTGLVHDLRQVEIEKRYVEVTADDVLVEVQIGAAAL